MRREVAQARRAASRTARSASVRRGELIDERVGEQRAAGGSRRRRSRRAPRASCSRTRAPHATTRRARDAIASGGVSASGVRITFAPSIQCGNGGARAAFLGAGDRMRRTTNRDEASAERRAARPRSRSCLVLPASVTTACGGSCGAMRAITLGICADRHRTSTNAVRVAHRLAPRPSAHVVDDAETRARASRLRARAADADHVPHRVAPPQRQRERAADQPDADHDQLAADHAAHVTTVSSRAKRTAEPCEKARVLRAQCRSSRAGARACRSPRPAARSRPAGAVAE